MVEILVQTATGTSSLASTTVTFTNNNVNGNSIIVAVGNSSVTAGDVSGITDTQGNIYLKAFATDNSSIGDLELWYTSNIKGGANTITVAYTTGVSCAVIAREYYGTAYPINILDKQTSTIGNSNALSSGNTGQTAQSYELLIGVGLIPLADTFSVGSGWNNLTTLNAPTVVQLAIEDQFIASSGIYAATFGANTGLQWVCGIGTFYLAPTGTTTSTSFTTSTSISSTSASSTSSSISTTSQSTSMSSTSTSMSSTSTSISSTSSSTSSTSISSTSSSTSISSTSTSISSTSVSSTSQSSTSSSTSISSTSTSFSSTSSSVSSTSVSISSTSNSSTSSSSSTSTTTLPPPYITYSYQDLSSQSFNIIALTDNFNGNSINSSKWTNNGGVNVIQSNGIQITTILAGSYFSLDSVNTYNLIGSSVFVEITNAGNQSLSSLEVILYAYPDGNNKIFWSIEQNKIIAYKIIETVKGTVRGDMIYNPGIHKYFRLRESNGITYWDYSLDGNIWSNYANIPNPISLTALTVGLQTGTFNSEVSATTSIYNNFNVIGASGMKNNMTAVQYGNVSTDDGDYFITTGSQYLVQEYKATHPNNTDNITFTWKGRSTDGPNESPIYLQIFNVNSGAWETVSSQTTLPADTDFTLQGTQTTSLSNYYDSNNVVTWRVYQLVV